MQVLVVDDEAPVREALRRALTLEGYSVELAADGAEALHRLSDEGAADAVVLDVLMPGIDGLEVCRRIRSAGSGIPVLMLTARDEIADRVAGLDAGADDYLVKPFALEELLARLRALLRRSSEDAKDVLRFADQGMRMASRYLATVRRAISMPSPFSKSTMRSSDNGAPELSPPIARL